MAKTAVMVRLSETEVSALDALALKSGISRATCATSILRQRLGSGIPRNTVEAVVGQANRDLAEALDNQPKPTLEQLRRDMRR